MVEAHDAVTTSVMNMDLNDDVMCDGGGGVMSDGGGGGCCTSEKRAECREIVELLSTIDTDDNITTMTNGLQYTSSTHRQVSEGTKSHSSSDNNNNNNAIEDDVGDALAMAENLDQPIMMVKDLALTGRPPIQLYLSCNPDNLSPYQTEIRRHIEFFEATPAYVNGQRVKGRNKTIVLGQVGIQCRHCSHILPPHTRAKGSTYFPQEMIGIYQAAQILSSTHLLDSCPMVTPELRETWKKLQQQSTPSRTVGKEYWAKTAQALGVYKDDYGLRFESKLPGYDELMHRKNEGMLLY